MRDIPMHSVATGVFWKDQDGIVGRDKSGVGSVEALAAHALMEINLRGHRRAAYCQRCGAQRPVAV